MEIDNRLFPDKASFVDIQKYNSFFDEYAATLGETVHNPKCERIKEVLAHFDHHDELYTIDNLKEHKIKWEHGVDKWLGYASSPERPINEIYSLVHPFVQDWFKAFAFGILHHFVAEYKNPSFLHTRYVINIPLRKKDGKYMAVKKMTMPFEFDDKGKIVSTLTSYTIFDEYKGQPFNMRMFNQNERLYQAEEEIKKSIAANLTIDGKANLTKNHFDIIDAIQSLSDENRKTSYPNIADVMNRSIRKKKAISESIRHYLSKEMKKRISYMLHGKLLEKAYEGKELEDQKKILPDYNDHFELVDFLVKSGIKDILFQKFLLSKKS